MINNRHILFVHIPKTAGTSFRSAARQYFGDKYTFFDYSPESEETSIEVLEKIYKENDRYAFSKIIHDHTHSFLCGHFPVSKYSPLYLTQNVVSFVREPVAQVISHFNHYVTYLNYHKTIEEFIEDERFRNLQTRLLMHKPIGFFGFLGVTEKYEESIRLFNALYETDFHYLHENKKQNNTLTLKNIDDALVNKIKILNSQDICLYEKVCNQFEVRKKLYKKKQPFTYGYIQEFSKGRLKGCAFQQNNQEAIELEIYNQNKLLSVVVAKDFRPGLISQGIPRNGFIGFEYIFNTEEINMENVEVIVKKTGQIIK